MDKGIAQLEWSIEVMDRGLAISPLNYPPEPGLHAANGRTFNGLHGFLSDSLPEQWGYLVLRKRLAKLGIDIARFSRSICWRLRRKPRPWRLGLRTGNDTA